MKINNFLFGIDVGTTKICAIVGEVQSGSQIIVRGVGLTPSHGLRKGIVVDTRKTVNSIKAAVRKAEQMAGIPIKSACVGLAGSHISSLNSKGAVTINSREHLITTADRERAVNAACAVSISPDREIIHVIPRDYLIDGQGGVREPVGMAASNLEVEVHIVTGAITSIQNIVQCVHQAGIEVDDIVLEPIASSKAVVDEEDKALGVSLVDIGGGTTDVAIFQDSSIWHTFVLPVGGNHFTHDIAIGLKIPILQAEQIKRDYGCALLEMVDEFDFFEIRMGNQKPKPILRQRLAEIVEPRAREVLTMIKREMIECGQYKLLPGGIILTGGACQLEGLPLLASQIFDLPVRVGFPGKSVSGLTVIIDNPVFSTAVGLLIYAKESRNGGKPLRSQDFYSIKEIMARARRWFQEFLKSR